MKKNGFKMIACAFVMTAVLSLGACSGGEKKAETKTDGVTEEGKFNSIKDYLKDETVAKQIEQITEASEEIGVKLDITADGERLVYSYTYEEIVKSDSLKQQLTTQMESNKAVYQNTAASLKEAIDVEKPVVVVEYVDSNGDSICSAEFTAE